MKIQYHMLNFLAKITNCFSLSFLTLTFFPQIKKAIRNLDFLVFEGIILVDDCSNFSSVVLSNLLLLSDLHKTPFFASKNIILTIRI